MALDTRLTKTIGAVAGAVLLLLVAAAFAVDAVARSALERTLTRTLGTEASVGSVDVGIFSGRVSMEDLRVANPAGFRGPRFLSLEEGHLAAGLTSLLRDTVEVTEMVLSGMDLHLEQRGGSSNFGPILASVKEARAGRETRDGTRYRIGEFVMRDVSARVRVGTGAGDAVDVAVEIPEIRLQDLGSGDAGAVSASELAGIALQAALRAVARDAGGLPGTLRGLLRSELGALEALPGGPDVRWPGSEEERSLREQAEEKLEGLLPGGDG